MLIIVYHYCIFIFLYYLIYCMYCCRSLSMKKTLCGVGNSKGTQSLRDRISQEISRDVARFLPAPINSCLFPSAPYTYVFTWYYIMNN